MRAVIFSVVSSALRVVVQTSYSILTKINTAITPLGNIILWEYCYKFSPLLTKTVTLHMTIYAIILKCNFFFKNA